MILLAVGISASVEAQYVSLSSAEVKNLNNAIKADEKVKKEYEVYKNIAQKALNETPNPILKVTSQGLLQGNPAKTASLKAVEDGPKIYALALNYRLNGDKAYLNKAQEFLLAWAKLNQATGDPIDETKLEEFFAGYDLIRADLKKDQQKEIDNWMESIAVAELNSPYSKRGKSTAVNNWNSHRIKVITQAVYAIHAENKYRDTLLFELNKQIGQNLYADGSSFDFAERDALHYHIYTLEPLLKAMIVLNRAEGKNYYAEQSSTGSSVKKSVDFLMPFVTSEKTHGEFANSKVKFDRDRAANGEKGYIAGAPFKQKNGIIVLSLVDYFDPSVRNIITQVAGDDYSDWQLVLNQVREKVK